MLPKRFIRKKLNHGIADALDGYMPPRDVYFHSEITTPVIGYLYMIPQKKLGITYEGMLPEFFPVIVSSIYDYLVVLTRGTRYGIINYAVDTWTFNHYAQTVNVDKVDNFVDNFYAI